MSFATILIVEDNEETLGVLKKTLIAHGYSVVDARVGDDALLRFRENRPDLILLGESLAELSRIVSRTKTGERRANHCADGTSGRT